MLKPRDNLEEWFEREVKIHEHSLRVFLLKRVPSESDIDDILQESYSKILRQKENNNVRFPKSLLFTIAKNISTDLIRKKYVSNTISLGEEQLFDVVRPDRADPQRFVFDDVNLLKEAIKSLPPKCRKIILMRNFEELPLKEIALRMNISVKTVEAQLTIGMKKCKKYFETHGDFK